MEACIHWKAGQKEGTEVRGEKKGENVGTRGSEPFQVRERRLTRYPCIPLLVPIKPDLAIHIQGRLHEWHVWITNDKFVG